MINICIGRFLATLKSAGVGLNLTAGNIVILLDMWWNASVEKQAMDRVYRLGQQRPVSVFRIVIENSIEERVLQIQEKKLQMASQAFGEVHQTTAGIDRLSVLQKLLQK